MKSAKPKSVLSGSKVERRLAAVDPALGRVIAAVIARKGPQKITPSHATPFAALARAVVYQSVSGKAAASIFARLKETVGRPLTPSSVLSRPPQSLAGAGLSGAKVRTLRNLAQWFASNPTLARKLPRLPDDQIVGLLGDIPGIGIWTINVFLIFDLGRQDVMPTADLGIRCGLQLIDGSRSAPTARQVIERTKVWSPYRSIASIYLWQAGKLKLKPGDLKKTRS